MPSLAVVIIERRIIRNNLPDLANLSADLLANWPLLQPGQGFLYLGQFTSTEDNGVTMFGIKHRVESDPTICKLCPATLGSQSGRSPQIKGLVVGGLVLEIVVDSTQPMIFTETPCVLVSFNNLLLSLG